LSFLIQGFDMAYIAWALQRFSGSEMSTDWLSQGEFFRATCAELC